MQARPLRALALLFLRLGATGFGGPAAHIGLLEHEVVRRRHWLTHEEFLDLLGATNLIPGPNSTEMVLHVGRRQAGGAGLVVAGVSFILPAALLSAGLAWVYVCFGRLPEASALLYGVKPVIIAVVLHALLGLARVALRTRTLAVAALLAAVANGLGVDELTVLLVTGGALVAARQAGRATAPAALLAPVAIPATVAAPFGLGALFVFFVKVGALLFGSGYVLLAFLQGDLVERWHWLSESQLLDAVAVGQITPGPLFSTATFIGFLLAGPAGAAVATVGIFLPAFLFVAASGPLIPRLRRSPIAGAFLDGVNAASLALMAVVTWHLARAAVIDATTALLAIASLALLARVRLNSAWLVLGGALVGLAAGRVR